MHTESINVKRIRHRNLTNIFHPSLNTSDVTLQEDASNYKINIYDRKNDGTYKRRKETLDKVIRANTCQEFTTTRDINPCEKNFWQVNMKGALYNEDAENGWYYKDKECKAYSFDSLPFNDPQNPPVTKPPDTAAPSLSHTPTVSPSTSPSLSQTPTVSPSNSPSLSKIPSSRPSLSTKSKGKGKSKGKSTIRRTNATIRRRARA